MSDFCLQNLFSQISQSIKCAHCVFTKGLYGGSDDNESTCNTGDPGLSLGREVPLEEGMAPHSSILAWRTPWTMEMEAGGLQSMGSQRVGHD